MRAGALLLLLVACGSSAPPVAEPVTPTRGALVPSELVAAPELRAAMTVVLRPDRWSEVSETVAAWIGADPPGDLGALLSPRPEELLRLESRRWFAIASQLTGLDRSRPVVFRLFEPRIEGLDQLLEVVDGERRPYRHVILLPSERPTALADELTARLVAPAERDGGECQATEEGLRCERHGVVVRAREGEVVVVVDGDGVDVPSRAAFERDASSPLSVTFHAGALREVGAGEGAYAMYQALRHVDPEYHAEMQAAGLAELAGAFLRTAPFGREIALVRLSVQPRVGLGVEAQLTEHGVSMLEGPPSSAAPATPTSGFVKVRTSLPLAAIRERAGLPFGVGDASSPREIAQGFQSCGSACFWQALTAPFAHAALMQRVTGGQGVEALSVSIDETMPAGRLDVEWDLAAMSQDVPDRDLAQLASRLPRVYLRSQVRGARWVGVIARDPDVQPPSPTGGAPAPSPSVDAPSLACLERLAIGVADTLQAYVRVESSQRAALLAQARAEVQAHAACVADPALVEERDAWLLWLARP